MKNEGGDRGTQSLSQFKQEMTQWISFKRDSIGLVREKELLLTRQAA